jgi:MFS superfamily sulfate permease-like transporter
VLFSGSIALAPDRGARLRELNVSTLLIVVLILVLLAVTPRWSYSARWGYGPSGIVGIVLIVIIVLALLGRI